MAVSKQVTLILARTEYWYQYLYSPTTMLKAKLNLDTFCYKGKRINWNKMAHIGVCKCLMDMTHCI